MSYDGGYYLIREPMMRSGLHSHTAQDADAVSDTVLRALNVVQSTAWRVNGWVLDVMREAWANGDEVGALPSPHDEPLPPRLPDDLWDAMDRKARSLHKYAVAETHGRNARSQSKRESFLRKLATASELRSRPSIYFPHFTDFRGRFYPLVQDLNPQGDDSSRGLLMFSEGKPLGDTGVRWLAIRLANSFGLDKLSYDERVAWVEEHTDAIIESGTDPLAATLWVEADEPWGFLATAREWALMYEESSPRDFVSHLPIPLDGTANGLQHLSMWGRDPVGARATNCSSEDRRFDLYSEVAEEVIRITTLRAAEGSTEAVAWLAKGIDRKVVKRAVMTTPYGVTNRGIRAQLVSDGHTADLDASATAAAAFMQEAISEALENTVVKAKEIMAYIQTCAATLARDGKPMSWTTPAGMRVTQAYNNLAGSRVNTLQGRIVLWDEDESLGINVRKQMLASAPNVIHSFDAAHMQRTVLRCLDGGDIKSFAFIHDSFGTHAADTTVMAWAIRAEMAEMYAVDRLAEFHEDMLSQTDADLPDPPALGDFDVDQVRSAPYFFA